MREALLLETQDVDTGAVLVDSSVDSSNSDNKQDKIEVKICQRIQQLTIELEDIRQILPAVAKYIKEKRKQVEAMIVEVSQIKHDEVPVIQLDYKNKKQWEPLSGVILDGGAGVNIIGEHMKENMGITNFKPAPFRCIVSSLRCEVRSAVSIRLCGGFHIAQNFVGTGALDKPSSSNGCANARIPTLTRPNLQEVRCSVVYTTNLAQLLDSTCSLSEDRLEASTPGRDPFEILPDHLIVEVLTRLPVANWVSAACVQKRWAALFRSEILWQTAFRRRWPNAERIRRWPGPIGRGSHKRRYIALHISKNLFSFEEQDGDIHELVGHAYLFLMEQLQVSAPLSYGLLHGTVIAVWMADALGIVPNCQNSILEWFRAHNRMDGYKEEGSSSQDRQSNPTVHEVGEGSSQAEEGFPHAAFSITGTASPGTLFGGMQSMVPNPMYANIGLHPGFQGTQG
ncbi:hypothetical protein L7F22_013339 [Adiantum nelumboides]|nr:hypothetical protein [Adiantum nelumboides]